MAHRIARRRPDPLLPRIRVLLRIRLEDLDLSETYTLNKHTAMETRDRIMAEDDGFERTLQERRRRLYTRLCVEQLYRFEEA